MLLKTEDQLSETDGCWADKTYTEALNDTLRFIMSQNPNVFCMGQGINDKNGYWGITEGLVDQYGNERVFDTPLSEAGLMGIATGSALAGLHPIYFHNRPDFLWLTMDQFVNHATKTCYMSGGKCSVPMIIWSAVGKGWGSGAQHSQSLQTVFMHIPGCKVVMPTTPYDVKGLMISAVKDNNPVVFLEHRQLLNQSAHVPDFEYSIPFGKGVIRKSGNDVTIIGISVLVKDAERAAIRLKQKGIDAEILDLRTIKPWDKEMVINSVKKTGRLIIADTSWKTMGVSSEIACSVYEEAFDKLKRPIVRLGNADTPTPANQVLEEAFYVSEDDIYNAAVELLK